MIFLIIEICECFSICINVFHVILLRFEIRKRSVKSRTDFVKCFDSNDVKVDVCIEAKTNKICLYLTIHCKNVRI